MTAFFIACRLPNETQGLKAAGPVTAQSHLYFKWVCEGTSQYLVRVDMHWIKTYPSNSTHWIVIGHL